MRSKRLATAVASAVALAVAPVAAAGMLHSTLGAHLSGMGESGIVNLQAHNAKNRLCWKFELNVMHVVAATVRDKSGMIVARLGHMYRAQGCATVPKTSLHQIEANPSHYWVWVATKSHPGELRGKLFAGMAHM